MSEYKCQRCGYEYNAEKPGCPECGAVRPVPFAAAAADKAVKPSIGLLPRKSCVENRLNEIIEAIVDHHKGQYTIPVEWFEEAAEIGRWLEKQKSKNQ